LSRPLEKKIEHYRATLELLETVASGVPFLEDLHSELDELDDQQSHERAQEVARRAVAAIDARDADGLVAVCHWLDHDRVRGARTYLDLSHALGGDP
jgi:hypothetical protein